MVKAFRWDKETAKAAREKLKDALTKQFNSKYGTDVDDIKNWQLLSNVLGISPASEDLDECRHVSRKLFHFIQFSIILQVVLNTHVNLVDLVMHDTDRPLKLFNTEFELSIYTQESQKFFPRKNVHAGGVLKYLLRRILDPPSEERVRYWDANHAVVRSYGRW